MKYHRLLVAGCALGLGLVMTTSIAAADEVSSAPASVSPQAAVGSNASDHPVGSATHSWLSLQSSNTAAAPARPGGGEEASLVYHRYLDSFKHAIPAFFTSSTGKSSGAPSGASN